MDLNSLPSVETLPEQQAAALAQQDAALVIEKALRAAGLPYAVWIIAAEHADQFAQEARALTARLVTMHPAPEGTTCEAA